VFANCNQTYVIVGNFNLKSIDWSRLNSPDDCINRPFMDFTNEHGFCQCVHFATRQILDIILTDDDELKTAVESDEPIGNSDHLVVHFSMFLKLTSANNTVTTMSGFNLMKTDFE